MLQSNSPQDAGYGAVIRWALVQSFHLSIIAHVFPSPSFEKILSSSQRKRAYAEQGRKQRSEGEATDLDGEVDVDGSAAPRSFSSSRMRAARAGPATPVGAAWWVCA